MAVTHSSSFYLFHVSNFRFCFCRIDVLSQFVSKRGRREGKRNGEEGSGEEPFVILPEKKHPVSVCVFVCSPSTHTFVVFLYISTFISSTNKIWREGICY